jgi:FAD/FMN-containing dehydrogenase
MMPHSSISRRLFLKCLSAGAIAGLSSCDALTQRSKLSEHVLYFSQSHNNYSEYGQLFNKRIVRRPKYLAVCFTEQGVREAVGFAIRRNLKIAIKSGGHSFEGFSMNDGGVVIDLSNLNNLETRGGRQWIAGPGGKLSEAYDFLLPKKIIVPLGSCGGVALGGLTLGGGYGLFSRKWGMTCDNLTGVRLVDGKGQVHDSENNPELLWACRGGGNGNFGVITELRYKTHRAPRSLSQVRIKYDQLDGNKAAELAKKWFSAVSHLPNDAFSAFILSAGKLTILITFFEEQSHHLVFDVVSELSSKAINAPRDALGPMSLLVKNNFSRSRRVHLFSKSNSFFKKEALELAVTRYYGHPKPLHFKNVSAGFYKGYEDIEKFASEIFLDVFKTKGMLFQINTLGGVISNERMNGSSAFPHRKYPFLGELQCYWNDDKLTDEKVIAVNRVQKKINDGKIAKHYRNYPSTEFNDWSTSYYGDQNYPRLQEIKEVLDPGNVFQHPQSVQIRNEV